MPPSHRHSNKDVIGAIHAVARQNERLTEIVESMHPWITSLHTQIANLSVRFMERADRIDREIAVGPNDPRAQIAELSALVTARADHIDQEIAAASAATTAELDIIQAEILEIEYTHPGLDLSRLRAAAAAINAALVRAI
jgi:hypothetical protein